MQITFIGTGSSRASINRFYSSVFVESEANNLLVDCGDGISQTLIKQNIPFNKINNILITHLHADHYAGIFSLINQMKLSGRNGKLTIFIYEDLLPVLEDFLKQSYLFREKMKFDLRLFSLKDREKIFIDKNFSIEPFRNSHITPENYPVTYESIVFAALSLYLNIDEKKIIYTSDLGEANDIMKESLQNPDILILETTHISQTELEKIFNYLSPGKMYLTHIDEENLDSIKEWISQLAEKRIKRIILAEDGMIIK